MISRTLVLKVAGWPVMERLVRKSFIFRSLVKRFIAGDSLADALQASEELVKRGFLISLDLLGENVKSESEANLAKAAYISMLQTLEGSPIKDQTNISIKMTQCGFDQGDDFAEKNYLEILQAAKLVNNCFVRVDMESSAYTERTIKLIEKVWPEFKNTGTVLQSCLYRTPDDVDRMIKLGIRVRIVKGAYMEPTTVAYKEKEKVDQAYVEIAKQLLVHGNYPAIASHDERIVNELLAFVETEGIDHSKFEFQMIYGVRRDLQDRLRAQGYNVRVYVPFGNSWYPYFTRRLAERPANMFFILKSLFKG